LITTNHNQPMKKKRHEFTLTVETHLSRRSAWLAVLAAFAKRDPDDCRFKLRQQRPVKESNAAALGVARWLASERVGASSIALAAATLGAAEKGASYPHDPDDLNRCLILIEKCPEARAAVDELAKVSLQWARLAPVWDRITATFIEEVGLRWKKGRCADRTYKMMDAALYPKEA
jgi:hypothetical protein